MEEDFDIIDIIPQDVNPALGLFVCRTKEGLEFNVTPKGTEEYKTIILFQKELYIGKKLAATFYEYTEDGKPFHIIDSIVKDYD